ncbi:MAG: tRNA uridine-5-carboxymethylaminomethyl(34) synthesis enzyme MnmG [Paludibacteraceae bacterium]|nr:tRNA uridine-5-carboxymethylaminomethyl(34) synthesis enzyme MnmG [Paludibacteraceae bacterium]
MYIEQTFNMIYDVIVIGAGHAGCEAASAAANMGSKTLLITMDMNKIAQMSCNPAVGGIAKGQIVREIDALGGQMGLVTDASSIQFRMLNMSKGPAMWSPRSQCDRTKFIDNWRKTLDSISGLDIWQDCVVSLIINNKTVEGVKCGFGIEFKGKTIILTAGTFLNGLMHVGKTQIKGGRISEYASSGLTEQLVSCGFKSYRMKTGTPMRIDGRTIDFSKLQRQDGDEYSFHKFSFISSSNRVLNQRPCWITFTNKSTHDILRSGLADSPLYNGQIKSIGPRYCPSIETKIVTFADKEQHQLFIEPEGETSEEYYINGFSSSLPIDVQFNAIHTIEGLENVKAYRPGYAIEYDYFDPTQLKHTLETKFIKNLFFAGQVNGTTGYEEAAGQGLIAGINAHLIAKGIDNEFVLGRDESYIGVLIDDLVNKGVDEPYRMFTSRAEYRILLRQDDADMRLTEKSYNLGLADRVRFDLMCKKRNNINSIIDYCKVKSVDYKKTNMYLENIGSSLLTHSTKLYDLLLRPNVTLIGLSNCDEELHALIDKFTSEEIEAAEIKIKYSGYIDRERVIADKLKRLDYIKIPADLDYNVLQSLSTEARQKLMNFRPSTIGDASRIPGVSPNDINVLLVLLGR